MKKLNFDLKPIFDDPVNSIVYSQIIFDELRRPVDLKIKYANPVFLKFVALDAKEVTGKKLTDIINKFRVHKSGWINFLRSISGKTGSDISESHIIKFGNTHQVFSFSPQKNHLLSIFIENGNQAQDFKPPKYGLAGILTEHNDIEKLAKYIETFPRYNPNPLIEIGAVMQVTLCNPAAKIFLEETGLNDARVFLPEDINDIFKLLWKKSAAPISREVIIKDRTLEERILYIADYNVIRIYCRDITAQKNIETELRKREQLMKEAQSLARIGNFKYEIGTGKLYWSEELFEIFGRDKSLSTPTYNEFLSYFSPVSLELHKSKVIRAIQTFEPFTADYEIIRDDNKNHVWIKAVIKPVNDKLKGAYLEGVLQDITELKKTEFKLLNINRALRTISACNQVHVKAKTEKELLSEICKVITREGGYLFAWVGYAENNKKKSVNPVSYAGYEKGYLEKANITWNDNKHGRGPTGTAIRTGKPAICNDMMAAACCEPWHKEAKKNGYSSSIVLPLISESGVFGALSIYSSVTNAFDTEEVKLLNELSEDLSFSIIALRNNAERMKAEEKAKEAQRLYRIIFENSDEGLFLTSPDGRIFDSNPAATRILGYSREEIISGGRNRLLDTTDPRLQEYLERRLKNGFATGELRFIHKSGRLFEGEVTSRIFYNENGESFTSMIVRDISERKRMQELLTNQEKELRTIFEILPVAVSIVDEKRNIIKANPAMDKVLGIPEDKIPVASLLKRKYFHGDLTVMNPSEFPSTIAISEQRTITDKEIGILKEEGDLIWTNVSAAPLINNTAVVVATNMTERKKTEIIIKESERNLKEAQKLAKLGSFNFNPHSGKIIWSDEMFNIFGRDKNKGEPNYDELKKYYTEESWKRHIQLVNNAIEKKENYESEFMFIRGDNGNIGWLNAIGKVNVDSSGKVYEIFGTAQDITESKTAMQRLNKLNEEILDLYNNAPCGYHSLDKDGKFIRINDTELRWLGYKRDEVLGKIKISDILTHDSYKKFTNTYPELKNNGHVNDLELEFIRKDKSVFYANVNSTAVYDENGKYKHSRSSIFDITARKEAEWKLEESSKNWNDTFNAMKDFIWLLDENGTIIQSNKKSKEYFCTPCSNEIGKKCFEIMHNTESRIHDCPFTVMHISKQREVKEHIREGRTYSVTVDPILDKHGELIGAVHIMSDITKLKDAENQMRDFANHLQKAREEERTLISRTLHDNFGQSLTGLKMEISSLEKKLMKILNTDEHPEIHEKFNSMKSILDDSVALTSKISTELRPNVLDMLGLIPAIEWLTNDFREKSGLECIFERNTDSIEINPKNSTEVFRILQEALTNVIRHANATKIKIKLVQGVDGYRISVNDNGIGIKEIDKKSPYSLGILGMRERATTFNGNIEITGKSNQGTELNIIIPNITL